ncbi:hypothetical protein [Jiangella gansuensis]|uniref:hypothetical protein n=1 Tax=Jiangella gansuensis TaxID=281473 RepID=UPI0004B30159|nr:hypothetical protein [Jiangella gansuensis]
MLTDETLMSRCAHPAVLIVGPVQMCVMHVAGTVAGLRLIGALDAPDVSNTLPTL